MVWAVEIVKITDGSWGTNLHYIQHTSLAAKICKSQSRPCYNEFLFPKKKSYLFLKLSINVLKCEGEWKLSETRNAIRQEKCL